MMTSFWPGAKRAAVSVRSATGRLVSGLLAKDHSLATGMLLGLLVWTLTRVVNGVVTGGAIEYAVDHSASVLSDGRRGSVVSVVLTNLSQEPVRNVDVAINDPLGRTTFSKKDKECTYPPPNWAEDPDCDALESGLKFRAPILGQGNSVRMWIKYIPSDSKDDRPAVRIRVGSESKARLIEPGLETFIARHELSILTVLLVLVAVVLAISVIRGVTTPKGEPR